MPTTERPVIRVVPKPAPPKPRDRQYGTWTDRGMTMPLSSEQWHVLAHLSHWCHLSTACPLCKAQDRAYRAERALDQIIEG